MPQISVENLIKTYRVAERKAGLRGAFAGMITEIVFGLVIMMAYQAFYRSSAIGDHPLSIHQVVTYIWLGQALLAILPWNGDPEIRDLVRSGGVAYELLRPVDLYTYNGMPGRSLFGRRRRFCGLSPWSSWP